MSQSPAIAGIQDRELTISRIFNAPRHMVWQAWTDPEYIIHWWGPRGFTNTSYSMDVRPGGTWRFMMHGPDGRDYPNKITYREVIEPERLEYEHTGEEGETVQFYVSVTFEDVDGKTRVTMRMVFPTAEELERVDKEYGAKKGLGETITRLGEYLEQMPQEIELHITRSFDAPRELVWQAWTEPDMLMKWCCPSGFTMLFCEGELCIGGQWRTGMRSADGEDYVMRGVYREITFPERLVFTHCWEEDDGSLSPETVVTVTLTEREGKTVMSFRQTGFASHQSRDSHNEGWSEVFEKLQTHVFSQKYALEITRTFDVSREAIWQAWTDPKHLAQWWGPEGFTNPVCELDLQPGGAIRIDMRSPDGTVYPMSGVVQEVIKPERFVFTSAALDNQGNPIFENLNTITFTENQGKTTLKLNVSVVKVFDPIASSYLDGMEAGWKQSLDRLSRLESIAS